MEDNQAGVASAPRKRLRPWEKILVGVSLLCVVASLCYIGARAYSYYYGPLLDEWQCSDGEYPILYDEGGSACIPERERVPANARKDPLGNRPFSCDNRKGWEPIVEDATGEEDCLRTKGGPMPLPPSGYSYRDWVIMS